MEERTFIVLVCICVINKPGLNGQSVHSGSNIERKEMELFLNEHLEKCMFISLCTLYNEETHTPVSESQKSCCRACSCRADCGMMGNCCPDYEVYKAFGNVTLENITELVDKMDAIGMFSSYNGMNAEPNSTQGTETINSTCLRPQLKNGHDVMSGSGYQMVTSCPVDMSLVSDLERTDHVRWDILYSNVPVYSLNDKRTYENKICMKHHSQNSTHARYWQVILRCKLMTFEFNRFYHSPTDIMKDVLSRKMTTSSCNIVYEPEKTMAYNSCSVVDVTSCLSGGQLGMICQRYFLPVDGKQGSQMTTYKNIACMKCYNQLNTHNATCRDLGEESSFIFNLPQNVEQYKDSSELDVQFDKIGYCKRGYVYDEVLTECRLVLCPRLMYSLGGACVPIFRRLTPVYYTIMIKASIVDDTILSKDIDNVAVFIKTAETRLIHTMKNVLRNNLELENVDFDLYQKPSTNNLLETEYYFIYLKFWNSNLVGDYSWARRKAHLLLREYQEQTLDTVYGKINVYLALLSTVQITDNSVIELTSKTALVLRYSWHSLKLQGQEIHLSASTFCYRIALRYQEMRFFRTYLTVTRTQERVYPVNFDNLADTGAPLVCLGTLFPHLKRDEILRNDEMTNKEGVPKPIEQPAVTNVALIGFSALASVIVTVLIILVLRLTLTKR